MHASQGSSSRKRSAEASSSQATGTSPEDASAPSAAPAASQPAAASRSPAGDAGDDSNIGNAARKAKKVERPVPSPSEDGSSLEAAATAQPPEKTTQSSCARMSTRSTPGSDIRCEEAAARGWRYYQKPETPKMDGAKQLVMLSQSPPRASSPPPGLFSKFAYDPSGREDGDGGAAGGVGGA